MNTDNRMNASTHEEYIARLRAWQQAEILTSNLMHQYVSVMAGLKHGFTPDSPTYWSDVANLTALRIAESV